MDTGIKLLNPVSNCTRIRNCIEDYVMSLFPFDLQIGWFMGTIDYRYPDKPEDKSTGFLSYNAKAVNGRLKLKTARYLTRRCSLNEHLNDEQIRVLAEKINSMLWTDEELNNVEILHGSDITNAYKKEIGGSSCMTGYNSEYTGLYASNLTRFGMLVIRNGNDSARAIVHHLDNGRKLLGCVYTTAEHLLGKMNSYAIQQGWYNYRDLNDVDESTLVMSHLYFKEGEIPYMDVLTQGEICGDLLTVSYNNGSFSLQNQDGTLEGGYHCEHCGDYIHVDDTFSSDNGNTYCEECFDELFIICQKCNCVVCKDDSIHIEDVELDVCQYCAYNAYHQCKTCGEYHSIDDTHFVNGSAYCESCFDDIADTCAECGETYLLEDLASVSGSEPLCDECGDAVQEERGVVV